ncbi:MAG: FAD binding domain-containing protein, partial [Methanosarcinaceae archaeon]|nr:FAD binding domain-containing protein [Methanosarcinaceae archaeon]
CMSSRILPEFDLLVPQSIPETVEMLTKYQNKAAIMAGGTDLLVLMKAGLQSEYLLSLAEVPGLDYVLYDPSDGLRIGAMATLAQIVDNENIKKLYPALWQSACVNGTPQTRNKATVVGNILRASPAGDCCAAAMALGGTVVLQGAAGKREVDIDNFWVGYRVTARQAFEFAVEYKISANVGKSAFKRMTRSDQDLSKLNAAACLNMAGNVCQGARLAMGCVAPTLVRMKKAEEILKGKEITDAVLKEVVEAVKAEVTPIDDVRSSAWYRKEVSGVLVKRTIEKALA